MKRLTIDNLHYFFSPDIEPVVYTKSGDTITVETQDALSGIVKMDQDLPPTSEELEEMEIPGVNPVTGPIYVEGAERGDNLAIEINDIECGSQGVTILRPGVGGLSGPYTVLSALNRQTKICPIRNGKVFFPINEGNLIEIPSKPIIGTIGVAPKSEKISTAVHGKEHCGNIDSPDVTVGNKIILPVNVKGALLSLGDVAAVSGDGELCVSHIDTTSETTITIEVIKKDETKYVEWPQIEFSHRIGSIGCPRSGRLDDACKAAYLDLIHRLVKFYGFKLLDAYQLLSAVGEIRVNQCIEPDWFSCVAKIQKIFLSKHLL